MHYIRPPFEENKIIGGIVNDVKHADVNTSPSHAFNGWFQYRTFLVIYKAVQCNNIPSNRCRYIRQLHTSEGFNGLLI